MISQKAKYALRPWWRWRAPRPGMHAIGQIAAQQKIPRKFLEQILLELKRDGLLASRRGKFGGYGLLKPADRSPSATCSASSTARSRPSLVSAGSPTAVASDCADERAARSAGFSPAWPTAPRRSRSHHPCRLHRLDECGGRTRADRKRNEFPSRLKYAQRKLRASQSRLTG